MPPSQAPTLPSRRAREGSPNGSQPSRGGFGAAGSTAVIGVACAQRALHASRPCGSAGQARPQQRLSLLGALAALPLGAPKELGELGVSVALGVLRVVLEAQDVAQALLGEPDDVVVLVLGAGDLAGLLI